MNCECEVKLRLAVLNYKKVVSTKTYSQNRQYMNNELILKAEKLDPIKQIDMTLMMICSSFNT